MYIPEGWDRRSASLARELSRTLDSAQRRAREAWHRESQRLLAGIEDVTPGEMIRRLDLIGGAKVRFRSGLDPVQTAMFDQMNQFLDETTPPSIKLKHRYSGRSS